MRPFILPAHRLIHHHVCSHGLVHARLLSSCTSRDSSEGHQTILGRTDDRRIDYRDDFEDDHKISAEKAQLGRNSTPWRELQSQLSCFIRQSYPTADVQRQLFRLEIWGIGSGDEPLPLQGPRGFRFRYPSFSRLDLLDHFFGNRLKCADDRPSTSMGWWADQQMV